MNKLCKKIMFAALLFSMLFAAPSCKEQNNENTQSGKALKQVGAIPSEGKKSKTKQQELKTSLEDAKESIEKDLQSIKETKGGIRVPKPSVPQKPPTPKIPPQPPLPSDNLP